MHFDVKKKERERERKSTQKKYRKCCGIEKFLSRRKKFFFQYSQKKIKMRYMYPNFFSLSSI